MSKKNWALGALLAITAAAAQAQTAPHRRPT